MTTTVIADTNLLIRLLTRDDDEQVNVLLARMETHGLQLYVPSIVLMESAWVLRSVYRFARQAVAAALLALLEAEEIMAEEPDLMRTALLRHHDIAADLADIYLAEKSRLLGFPVMTWNKKHFRKLDCDWIAPEDLPE